MNQLVADLSHVGDEELAVAGKKAQVPLVDHQVKVVDLDRVAVPVLPEELDGFKRKRARPKIPHKSPLKNILFPEGVHLLGQGSSVDFSFFGAKPSPRL